jgi:hypothetical protein
MITADGGGSNGSRVRLFKVELQKLADETGLTLQVCHFPPGTSKWNKIEHRLCGRRRRRRGLPHHPELAWQAADQSARRGRADRRNNDDNRSSGVLRA